MTVELTSAPPRRPFTLKAICVLLLLRGSLLLTIALFALIGGAELPDLPLLEGIGLGTVAVVGGTLAVLDFVAAVGLWRLQPWAWRLTMILMGILLLYGLWFHIADGAAITNSLGLLLNIVTVFYLVQRDVRELFGARSDEAPSL